ncbi:MAG TPA: type II secretion system F family protein [Nitrospira sp.]|nr:type II secretion system F family protein [Nitrospira sp.]
MTLIWIITGAVFLTTILISVGVYVHFAAREEVRVWSRRLQPAGANPASMPTALTMWLSRFSELLARLGAMTKPNDEREIASIKASLAQAGYRKDHATLMFIGLKLFLAGIGIVIVSLIPAVMWGFPSQEKLLVYYVIAGCVGYLLPGLWLKMAVRARQDKIQRAVPDALDLLVTCVEAGLGLDIAIAKVSSDIADTHPVLGEELTLLSVELRTGLAREEALRRLAARTGLEDVRTLVAVLVQTDRFGTSIAQALRVHADSMRVKRQLRAEALAAKLPVKMLFPLIFFILPSLFVVMLGPGVIRIIRVFLPMATQTGF